MASTAMQALSNQKSQQAQPNDQQSFQQGFGQFMQNPMQALGRFDIPQNLANNPQGILHHLTSTGQINQQQLGMVNRARQMISRLMPRR